MSKILFPGEIASGYESRPEICQHHISRGAASWLAWHSINLENKTSVNVWSGHTIINSHEIVVVGKREHPPLPPFKSFIEKAGYIEKAMPIEIDLTNFAQIIPKLSTG